MRKRMLMSALGMGAAYLLRNREAREKLFRSVQSFVGKTKRRVR